MPNHPNLSMTSDMRILAVINKPPAARVNSRRAVCICLNTSNRIHLDFAKLQRSPRPAERRKIKKENFLLGQDSVLPPAS
jgi:hypothetical protein